MEDLYQTHIFLSTPSARRATIAPQDKTGKYGISIHALREEGDLLTVLFATLIAPFLSTPSARRATPVRSQSCGDTHISIHALREEGDLRATEVTHNTNEFLSTPSARRATVSDVLELKTAQLFLSTPSARRATSSARMPPTGGQ